jgi:6-phosphogluconolactonase (cycloisomerase 2 family)
MSERRHSGRSNRKATARLASALRSRRLPRLAGIAGGVALLGAVIPPAAAQAGVLGPNVTAYVTDEGGSISQYAAGFGGSLTPDTPPSVSDANEPFGQGETLNGIPEDIAISASRKSVYVADWYGIEQYTISGHGTLTPKTPSFLLSGLPVGLGGPFVAQAVAVSPGGRSVYLGSAGNSSGGITEFTTAADGSLSSPISIATPAGDYPNFLTVSPDGRTLYASTSDSNNAILEYTIAANGTLTPKSQVVTTFGSPTGPLVLSADGLNAYLPEYNEIAEYDIAPSGTLTPSTYDRTPTVPSGNDVDALALSPDGRTAYAANASDNTLSEYTVGLSGRLTPAKATVPTGSAPGAIVVSPDGSGVYVTNFGDNTISLYSVALNGSLIPKAKATIATGVEPSSIAIGIAPGGLL